MVTRTKPALIPARVQLSKLQPQGAACTAGLMGSVEGRGGIATTTVAAVMAVVAGVMAVVAGVMAVVAGVMAVVAVGTVALVVSGGRWGGRARR